MVLQQSTRLVGFLAAGEQHRVAESSADPCCKSWVLEATVAILLASSAFVALVVAASPVDSPLNLRVYPLYDTICRYNHPERLLMPFL